MNRTVKFLLVLILIILICGCGGKNFLSDKESRQMDGYYIYAINDDQKTSSLILSSQDIIRWDWDKQIFLFPHGLIEKRIKNAKLAEGIPFEAYIGKDKVYAGRLVFNDSIVSSSRNIHFKEPIILIINPSQPINPDQPIKVTETPSYNSTALDKDVDMGKFYFSESDEATAKSVKDKRIIKVLDELNIIDTIK